MSQQSTYPITPQASSASSVQSQSQAQPESDSKTQVQAQSQSQAPSQLQLQLQLQSQLQLQLQSQSQSPNHVPIPLQPQRPSSATLQRPSEELPQRSRSEDAMKGPEGSGEERNQQQQHTNDSLKENPDVNMTSVTDESTAKANSSTQHTTGDGQGQPEQANGQPEQQRQQAPDQQQPSVSASLEARIPTKKDASLRDFLSKMDDYAPIIPDAVTNYYLTLGGLPPPPQTPPHLARLLALATQKFIADIAADAYQYARIRASNTSSASNPLGGLATAAQVPGGVQPGGSNVESGKDGAAGSGTGAGAGAGNSNNSNKKGQQALGVQRPGFGGGGQGGAGQGRTVLTMEDLGMAVGEYGLNVRRGEFYR